MLDINAIVRIFASSEDSESSAMGTGFLFGKKYILTCNHVVDDGSQIKIQFTAIDDSTNKLLQVGKVMGVKEGCLDYAVLEITEESLLSKPLNARCLSLTDTEEMQLSEGLFVQLAGHRMTSDARSSFYRTLEREVKLGSPISNGFYLVQDRAGGFLMQNGFSGSPVLDIRTCRIIGILDSATANLDTPRQQGSIGQMILSNAIKRSLKEYDEQHKTNFCDLLFTQEEPLDTSYIIDNYTEDIQNLAGALDKTIFFIGSEINLYKRNENLDREELNCICDLDPQFNVDQKRSLSEIELAYFLKKQIRKELERKGRLIKCLQAEIPELKDQAIDQNSPCPSCPYELSERPENCLFRLENDNQDQTNNQLSIEEQLMNAQVNVQFLTQYYINLCGNRLRVINEIKQFYDRSQPNEAHKLIAKYVKNEKIKLIITTNCDNLLERAFNSSPANIENYGVYVLPKDAIKSGKGPLTCLKEPKYPDDPIILKLHGCYNEIQATKALITRTDFLSYYFVSLCKNFSDSIIQIVSIYGRTVSGIGGCNIWLIGYTLSDHDINALVPILLNETSDKSPDTVFWIYHPSSILSKTNNVWKNNSQIKLIPRKLETFFNELEYFLLPSKNEFIR